MAAAMRTAIFTFVVVLVVALATLSRSFISPVDVLTGKERIVARQRLPNGDRIEIVQYWNHGDFYNLDLRHVVEGGKRFECVIDPDCNRIARCVIEVDAGRGEATVKVRKAIWARYKWSAKELVRKNGILIRADPAH